MIVLGFSPDDAGGHAPGGFNVGDILTVVHGE